MSVIDMSLIKFDEKGLVPVVVQDSTTAEVLMTAWANEEALKLTADSGELTLWSRSRKELWKKGETSGNVMKVVELRIDCDGDTLLAIVDPAGPSCHTGKRTCFYRSLWGKENSTEATFLGRLWGYLNIRIRESGRELYCKTPRKRPLKGRPEGRRRGCRDCDSCSNRRQGRIPL